MAPHLSKRENITMKKKDKSIPKEKDKLLKVLRRLCLVLQCLGVLPVFGNSRILKYLQRIWCLLLLLTLSFMSIRKAFLLDKSITTLEKGFYLSELIFMVLLPLNIFILSFTHKEKFLSICEKFKHLKQQLSLYYGAIKRPRKSIYYKLRMELLLLIYGLLLFYISCIILNYIDNHGNVISVLKISATYQLGNIIMNGNLGLYLFSMRTISLAYSYLNSILKSFRKDSPICTLNSKDQIGQTSSSFTNALWFKKEFGSLSCNKFWKFDDIFINLTEICFNLDQLMSELVYIFRIILILYFVNSFLIMVLQCFLIFKYFDSPDVHILLLFLLKCARLVLHIFNTITILLVHNAIISQKCQTIYILGSLPVDTLNREKNITYFLLQLMIRKHTIFVCDIFELDSTFLLSFTSALAMYVIFLIQIDLGVGSMEEEASIAVNPP